METTTKTFREQAECYILDIASDVRPATLHVYRSILDAQLIPAIGGMELEGIGNKTAKMLVGRLTEARLSPATIRLAVTVMKQILASATDDEGDPLYPRQWNSKFIKAPKVSGQKAPVMALEGTSEAIAKADPQTRALIALLGGTGLRIGEALAISVGEGIGNVWNASDATITIRATQTPSGLQNEPKTAAGRRVVDLHPSLNEVLCSLGRPAGQPLFTLSHSTARRRLTALGVPGFHSMRRMRITHLQNKNTPLMLIKFWVGHAAGDISEKYTKFGAEIESRKDWVNTAGLGFNLG
jgi:integrase